MKNNKLKRIVAETVMSTRAGASLTLVMLCGIPGGMKR